MNIIKVIALFFILNQCAKVLCRKYMKIVTIEKDLEHEHGVLLHHFKPISFIKETITPFGVFSFKHSVEKRDIHSRKRREIEDLKETPLIDSEKNLKPILEKSIVFDTVPTDIILTRMEFYKGKPIESINIHSVLEPLNSEQEIKGDENLETLEIKKESDIEHKGEESKKDIISEPAPLSIPEHLPEVSDTSNQLLDKETDEINNVDIDPDVEKISVVDGKVKSEAEDLKLHEDNHKEEVLQPSETTAKETVEDQPTDVESHEENKKEETVEDKPKELELHDEKHEKENIEEKPEKVESHEENQEKEIVEDKPKDLELQEENHEKEVVEDKPINLESHEESHEKEIVDDKPKDLELHEDIPKEEIPKLEPSKPVDITKPIDKPALGAIENRDVEALETHASHENIEISAPIKAEEHPQSVIEAANTIEPVAISPFPVSPLPQPVYIPLYTEIKPSEVHEVVKVVPPVVVITEKVDVPLPPPPPVQTVQTVIETEQTPSLFTRGSRFMLNISSRILKKLLRLVSSARTRLHLGSAAED